MAQPTRTHPIRRNSGRIERKWETEQNKKYNDTTREKQFQLKYLIVWLLGDNINFAPINMLRVHYLYHFTKIPNDSNIKAVELLSSSYFALVNYFSALFSAIEKPNYSPKSLEHFNGFFFQTIMFESLSTNEQYPCMQPNFFWIVFKFCYKLMWKKIFKFILNLFRF